MYIIATVCAEIVRAADGNKLAALVHAGAGGVLPMHNSKIHASAEDDRSTCSLKISSSAGMMNGLFAAVLDP